MTLRRRLDKLAKRRADRRGSDCRLTCADVFGMPLYRLLEISDQLLVARPPTGRPSNQFDPDAYLARLDDDEGAQPTAAGEGEAGDGQTAGE